ncbi:hypothetical protein BJ085DRAFT_17078 [Dimargaris cristalligena]|uniref:DNA-directed RNA polymerase subunit beta n=1 Tax=Dimargaris cristalligena TaxID=215637 RepID=A0A4P9ZLX5_9FUNG|nr:hypothetical protein BJ085DRAFT_17078 [Dimargaris cristalligena]|eukprot:RKP34163.1 hypothetical protein BJ085DRAFT_17078 [Dimargaris cristalligena]
MIAPNTTDASTFQTLKWNQEAINPGRQAAYPALQAAVAPHLESFNAIFEGSRDSPALIDLALNDLPERVVYDLPPDSQTLGGGSQPGNRLSIWFEQVTLDRPRNFIAPSSQVTRPSELSFPAEARERKVTYRGQLNVKFCWRVNDGPVNSDVRGLGSLPVMVRSNRCNLQNMGPAQLTKHREESEEAGGYFIMNGNEKIIRFLIVPRSNYITAIYRPSFNKRGPTYSAYGVTIRCLRPDTTSSTITVHYLTDGDLTLRLYFRKREYLLPLMLVMRALVEVSDKELFLAIVQGDFDNTFLTDRVELLLRSSKRLGLRTRLQYLQYLGAHFRVVLNLPRHYTDAQVGEELIRQVIAVHLKDNRDKFNLLVAMVQKIYGIVSGEYAADNGDSANNHEILLPGHLYLAMIKERLDDILSGFVEYAEMSHRRGESVNITNHKSIARIWSKLSPDIGRRISNFLATGNLVSQSGLDLNQTAGFTIIAEKLNFLRYISHFRCVHRGAFFATMKTTSVRKLLPESWGFMCPVHTPDGTPCGLLTHLSHTCRITVGRPDTSEIPRLLVSLGMSQIFHRSVANPANVTVQLDGRVVGYCTSQMAAEIARNLRHFKVTGAHPGLPLDMEIAYVPLSRGGQYPGLYLFTGSSRMIRPVKYLCAPEGDATDLIGTMEQVYLDIACMSEDVVPHVTTHMEFSPTHILSILANMTPFSDFNQSPRNMYQCQMGKQTMGTPAQALAYRADNKLYRIQSGQSPIVRAKLHADYGFDEFPNGTNACVAVISYTGYDMEDAMILNKSAHERGFKYGTVYKTELIDLSEGSRNSTIMSRFGLDPLNLNRPEVTKYLDIDGLPHIGARLPAGAPLYAFINETTNRNIVKTYKGPEEAVVDSVRLLGADSGTVALQKVAIVLRIPRPPVIGDKFSSRHGQKGVCSQKWPAIDMPFSESGIQPDIIINPHAFPSRMTIGMFVESIAAKAGAMNGCTQDSTPFQFSEHHTAADHFGEQLVQAGYNYHGNEPMYSGITGEEFQADIYFGVVYYQRLRHMVNDKFQVRSTGPINPLTHQPVKGRKRAGGIRFGEMERDALIAHGVSYLLQDRLLNCSDYTMAQVCKLCGSVISPVHVPDMTSGSRGAFRPRPSVKLSVKCQTCQTAKGITVISMPFVFRYLAAELASMNIRLTLKVGDV